MLRNQVSDMPQRLNKGADMEEEVVGTYPLVFNIDYYVKNIILSDLQKHEVDPPEDKIDTIREHVSAFLDDCLRVGLYYLYNFYGQWSSEESCSPVIYKRWTYDFYLRKHYMTFFMEDFFTIRVTKSIYKDAMPPIMRVCSIIQKPPYLPHPEVINVCGLTPDKERPGLRPWHKGDSKWYLGASYDFSDKEVPVVPKNLAHYILWQRIPFLSRYVIDGKILKEISEE